MKTTKFYSFLILTIFLLIFEVEPVMAQSNRYVRSARPNVSAQRPANNGGSYARKNQPVAVPRGQYQTVESRARQEAQIRMQGMQNSDRIKEEKARRVAERVMQNANNNAANNSSSSYGSGSTGSSSSGHQCSYCRGTGKYECHKGYYDVNHSPNYHNCPQCGASHDQEKSHNHKCMKCDGQGWK